MNCLLQLIRVQCTVPPYGFTLGPLTQGLRPGFKYPPGGSGLVFPKFLHEKLSAFAPLSEIRKNGTGSVIAMFCMYQHCNAPTEICQ